MRLQKFMADAGVASRRKCEELIRAGLVFVNGTQAELGSCVDPEKDEVLYQGKIWKIRQERSLLIFNKPIGVVCTTKDPEGRRTVLDYFRDFPERLYNVGRLDFDSEGLIFMSNDGELANRLMHPRFEIPKTYYVVCNGKLKEEEKKRLEEGVYLHDGMTAPALVSNVKSLPNGNTAFEIQIHEGRNRQVRRMVDAVGHNTLLLRRIRIGNIELGDLPLGSYRPLTETELQQLHVLLEISEKNKV